MRINIVRLTINVTLYVLGVVFPEYDISKANYCYNDPSGFAFFE